MQQTHNSNFYSSPLVTIITVVYNGQDYIQDAIESVLKQTYGKIEYIIIDGGSTDFTIDKIRYYEKAITFWVSEPDRGIYDAMNKGVSFANGDIIGILNSDDWYEHDAVESIIEAYCNNLDSEIFHGKLNVVSESGVLVKTKAHRNFPIIRLLSTPFKHPTCFVKSDLYNKIGTYNISYKVAADYDFMLRAIKNCAKSTFVNKPITNLRQVGVSTGDPAVSAQNEILDIISNYTSNYKVAKLSLNFRQALKAIKQSQSKNFSHGS